MKTPLTAQDYLARALAHDKAGREAKAIPDYEQALKLGLSPADERTALICMASSHRNVGEHRRAQSVIERARRKYPDDPVVDAFAALILLDAGRPQRAVRILGLALCNHAQPGVLDGFDTALTRKFRGATQPAAHVNGVGGKR
jgi:Flp pilus assembly protein TadD